MRERGAGPDQLVTRFLPVSDTPGDAGIHHFIKPGVARGLVPVHTLGQPFGSFLEPFACVFCRRIQRLILRVQF